MAVNNPNCPLNGTRWCALINAASCASCTVGGKGETPEQVIEDLKLYESLLPEGGLEQLYVSHTCQLCRGGEGGERAGYLLLDMAHPGPKHLQRKMDNKQLPAAGTVISLQFAVCPRCRKRQLALDLAPVLTPLVTAGLGLLAVNLTPIHDKLAAAATWLPLLVWLLSLGAGFLLGKLISVAIERSAKGDMIVDILKHPVVREMLKKGWVPVERENGTLLAFSKSRRVRGLGTTPGHEESEEDR